MISFANRLCAAVVCALAACTPAVVSAPAPAPSAARTDRWLTVELGGAPVGRTRETVEPLAGGGFATRIQTELRIGRLGSVVVMAYDVTLDEDARGELRSVRARATHSRQDTTTEVAFAAGTATIRESAGDGRIHTRTLAIGEPLLGPEAVRRALAAELRSAGDVLAVRTWSQQLVAPQRVQYTAGAREARAVDGATESLLRAAIVAEQEPAPRVSWLSRDGREVIAEAPTPMGAMIVAQVRREPALVAGELSSDAFARSLIRSNVRLPEPRSLDTLIVRLSFDDPAQAKPALDSADQRVTQQTATGMVVEIARVAVPAEAPAIDEPVAPALLGAGMIIDPEAPGIRAIVDDAVAGATDPWHRAQRLTRWVTEHMTFDPGIAFATTSELVRDRRGTCIGYATLLAALLRADAIPSRLVIGVVYVGGIFGGHAWVEARIRGRWLPLDAAAPSGGTADAARIALGRDALDAGSAALLSAFSQVVGRAKLHVIGYAAAGAPLVRVDESAQPYRVDGARYTNPGLGLSLDAPPGYRFTQMDAIYPDRTLLAIEGPGGRVSLGESVVWPGRDAMAEQARALKLSGPAACVARKIAGRAACSAPAGIAFSDGGSLFILEATGPEASALLDRVAPTLRFIGPRVAR